MKRVYLIFLIICLVLWRCSDLASGKWTIEKTGHKVHVKAGMLERIIEISGNKGVTSSLLVNGQDILMSEAAEFSVTLWRAFPNEEPQGIDLSAGSGIEQHNSEKNLTDALKIQKNNDLIDQNVTWTDEVQVTGKNPGAIFDSVGSFCGVPVSANKSFTITYRATEKSAWEGLSAEITYEIYDGFPVIRKWIRFTNRGSQWLKIGNLSIDDLEIDTRWRFIRPMTPAARGIDPCMVAFTDSVASMGIISVSEVPSRVRELSGNGSSGYDPDYFEWVLGPAEMFESEPVFMYAFSGESVPTVSSVSTALDRCVESEFKSFLSEKVLKPARKMEIAPLFCTWTNYNAGINDSNMRIAADVASRMGFKCFQLDAGWSYTGANRGWAVSSVVPDREKFPDMKGLMDYLGSKNLKSGLWYSVFISEEEAVPSGDKPLLFSLPPIRRDGGVGLSFCYEPSRRNYVSKLGHLIKNYNVSYFKQDLSNICYGDLAKGHESRTLRESYLRGLRGLFATQDTIHSLYPGTWLQISHETYWETPGPVADVAILKHADSYHSAPNEYFGAGNRKEQVKPEWKYDVDSISQKLIQGAFRAREFLYAQRGLPLDRIEIFGAVTTNYRGSLTPAIIDRQICSWLTGAPLSFSGDLESLTEENILQYSNRFSKLERLQNEFGIYSFYQFSGVPTPTDEDWHWWGKLNDEGCGVVVVLRGSGGDDTRKINIPWVMPGEKYHLKGVLSQNDFGVFKGKQLQDGALYLSLNPYGQEIIECRME
jgi:hypothetical protein